MCVPQARPLWATPGEALLRVESVLSIAPLVWHAPVGVVLKKKEKISFFLTSFELSI